MSFSGLESDADTATKDYVFRADVKDSEDGDADGCEDQAGGYGLGVDRYLNLVDENPETRTGSISADCPAGQYTVRTSISDANGSELAADSADFSVVEPPSTDAALSGLALSGVDMGTFDPATYSYDVNVGHDLAETTVTPTPNDEGATYVVRRDGVEDGDGTVPLAEGSNVISVEVTAEDGQTTKTYTVIVTRAASESDTQQQQEEEESGPEAAVELSPPTAPVGTSIGVTMSFANLDSDSDTSTTDYVFRADVRDSNGNVDQCEEQANGYGLGVDRYMYRVDEDPETRTGTISADCPVGAYTLRVSISTPENVELASGSADFTVFDPDAPKSTDAALSGLSLSDVDFGTFTSTTTAYTASVGNDVAETTVTPTTNDDGATCVVKLDGVANSNGTVSLTEGANVITIEVTAEDGETIKVYTVTVTRTPNSPATGLPTISGTAQVGQTLTADTSGIADADGLDNVAFSYQWLSSRDTEIKGATGSTYMLQAAHQGKVIKVRVTFTDDAGNLESLTSEATAVVSASTQIASEDEPSLRSHITVVVAEDTSDPDNPRTDFTVTWKDVDVCSTRYNAYFSNDTDVTRGGDTTHLGSAAADGSQITSSLSTVAGEGIDFTLELYCGTEDSGRRVSSVSIIHGDGPSSEESNRRLVPGAYSSEPPLTALIVSTGILTPTFHSHTPKYTVQNGVSAVDRLTVVATAKPDYRVVFIKDVIGGSYICSPWGFSCTEWYYQWGDGNQVYPLTDADADAPGFQVDLAAGEKLAMHVLRDYRGRTLHNEFYSLTVNRTPNTLATGAPTISGMAQVGETLTASTSEIADEDRLSSASFSYQWIRNSGTTDTDIAGATGATYTLVSADEGKTIKVRTTFTDDAGHQETLTSEGTAVVVPRPNSPATGLPTISGTAQMGETLTASTSDIEDADGLTNVAFSYQWLSSRDTEIPGATGDTYTLVAADEGKTIKVRVSFPDDSGNEETLTSTATAAVAAALTPNNICDRPQAVQDAIRTALDKTHLSCEQVTVHSSDFVTITQLRITGIQLTTLQSGSFYGLTGLRRLEISSCGLDELPEDIFDGLSNLESLDLSSNDLEELPEDIFDGLGNLKKLYLNSNELTALHQDVFDGLSNLEALGLSSNDLTALPPDVFEDLDSLEALSLAHNELGTLPVNVFEDIAATLSGLDVGYNDLALGELPSDFFASFTNLIALVLEGIGKDLEGDTEGTMTSLAYDWFGDLSNLELLYLSENELSSLPGDTFDGFSNLKLLLLGNNDLTELSADLLEDLTNLEELELYNNQLAALPDGLFKGLSNLYNVDLLSNPGAPFTFTAELEKSGNDGIVVKVTEGTPFSMDVTLAAGGGTLSETSLTIPAGSVQSEVITVTHSGSDAATIRVASAAFPIRRGRDGPLPGYVGGTPRGTLAGTGSSLTLSAPSDGESPNTPATGAPTISGTAQVGQTLTADTSGISDADGLTNVSYSYRWLSSRDTEIPSATGVTYTLVAADEGKTIRVRMTFTDDGNHEETLTSAPTTAVAASPASGPAVAIGLSPSGSVAEGTEIAVTMSFRGLTPDSDRSTTDYIFRADVVGADSCEGGGIGNNRYMYQVDEDPEVRTGAISAACSPGDYTVEVSISSPGNVELASATASFTVNAPGQQQPPEPPSTDATLSALTLSDAPFTFASDTTEYTANVANDVAQTTVTPTTRDNGATYAIKLDGVADADGVIPLAEGSNVITVEVTAEDGNTGKTYKVTVSRAAPAAPPDAPDQPTGEVPEPGTVTLDWEDVDGATGYQVGLWSQPNLLPLPSADMPGVTVRMNGSSARLTGLPAEWSHYWLKVRAINDYGASGWSDWLALENQ